MASDLLQARAMRPSTSFVHRLHHPHSIDRAPFELVIEVHA